MKIKCACVYALKGACAKSKHCNDRNLEFEVGCPSCHLLQVDFKPVRIIELADGQTGYDAVGDYIQRYWQHDVIQSVVCSISMSRDGRTWETGNEFAMAEDFGSIAWEHDWWEGERFLKVLGISSVEKLTIKGGVYEE